MSHDRGRRRFHILLVNTDSRPIIHGANAEEAVAPFLGDDAGFSDIGQGGMRDGQILPFDKESSSEISANCLPVSLRG